MSHAEIEGFIGPPLHATFERVLAQVGRTDVTPDEAVAAYREHFASKGLFENRVYDGVPAQLDALARAGHGLWVVTSKPTVYAERILAHFGLRERFEAVYGPDLDGRLADKTELIAHVLARESIDAADAVMIGDRSHDVIGAVSNDVRAVGVLWGYGSADELREAGAWKLCDAPSALAAALSGAPSASA